MTEEKQATTAEKKPKKAKVVKAKAEPAVVAAPQAFAIIRTGGKQYRVSPGMKIAVEKLDAEIGSTITISDVLMSGTEGAEGAKVASDSAGIGSTVVARVLGLKKEKKVIIFKKRRRGGYTKKQGHRQTKSELLIESVNV